MVFKSLLLAVFGLLVTDAAQAISLTGTYTQDFNSMGISGTTPPSDWVVYTGNSGTTNNTWATTIPANGTNSVASMVLAPTPLTATSAPTTNNNNGFNAALNPSTTSDRVLATSPTTVNGTGLQLTLTNNTGAALSGLNLGYDTVRFTAVGTANQLPGYWLFYSQDGRTWSNVSSLNPTISTVPNTVGITPTSGSFNFSTPVANGANFFLRWIDDNALQTSPDQIIGLNNVSITAIVIPTVPEPRAVAMFFGVAVLTPLLRRKRPTL
jgi:hypothetical protein